MPADQSKGPTGSGQMVSLFAGVGVVGCPHSDASPQAGGMIFFVSIEYIGGERGGCVCLTESQHRE